MLMFGSFTIESLDKTEEFVVARASVSIGRAADNDLTLPFPTVSTHHARVVADASGCRIVDLGSANGTLLNGDALAVEEEQPLRDGDVVQIGPFTLRFRPGSADPAPLARAGVPGVTAKVCVRPGSTIVLPPNLPPRLAVSTPEWSQEFALGRDTLTLGRDSDNDIVVPVEAVSRCHASLERRGADCLIKDLGSTNGIVVGGRRVEERLLAPGDHVRIGHSVTLQYLGSVDFAAELVAAAVQSVACATGAAATVVAGETSRPEGDDVSPGDATVLGPAASFIDSRRASSREARLGRTVEGAVLAIGHVMRSRDPYTAAHERRVAELAAAIAGEMGLEGEGLAALRLAALIHDIGKMSVPAEILAKPGRLNEAELNLIRQHVRAGYDIIESIEFGPPVAEMVLQHHERPDGSGYPQGLVGPQILLEARILAVADVAEAMSSHRPYRAALGTEAALAELETHTGAKYDVDVVAACVRLFKDGGFAFTL